MNEDDRTKLDQDLRDSGRLPLQGWWADLYEIAPATLQRLQALLAAAGGDKPIFGTSQSLIWVVIDAVVAHLFPSGLQTHMRGAMEEGASPEAVMEALEIAAEVSSCGYEIGLPVLAEVARELGLDEPWLDAGSTGSGELWERYAGALSPDYLAALRGLASARRDNTVLEPKMRELLFVAGYGCPAIAHSAGLKRHARRAIEAGATLSEVTTMLRLSNAIGVHSLVVGMRAGADELRAFQARVPVAAE